MKTNRLLVYALLTVLTGGCATEAYTPYSRDYYPEMAAAFRRHLNPARQQIVATDDFRSQPATVRFCAAEALYGPGETSHALCP
jgi:hypothetical protein